MNGLGNVPQGIAKTSLVFSNGAQNVRWSKKLKLLERSVCGRPSAGKSADFLETKMFLFTSKSLGSKAVRLTYNVPRACEVRGFGALRCPREQR